MTAPETYETKRDRIAATEYTPEQLSEMPWDGVEKAGDDERGHCPHCGVNLDNGFCDYVSMLDTNKREAAKMVREFVCLGCGEEYGPVRLGKKAKIAKLVTAMKTTQQPSGKVKIVPNGKSFGLVDSKGAWVLAAPSKRPGYPTPLRLFRTEAGAAAWVKKATA
jgi:hypothetical protein